MEIILIRHGKAQKRGTVSTDDERKLVPKGIEKLKNDLPYLQIHLKKKSEVVLWSSGIHRAKETAKIVSEICGVEKIYYKDFLETGEYKEMIKAAKKMPEDATIIMVGHEPDFSFWCEELCGKMVVFKKGGAAILKFNKAEQIPGELVMALTPGKFDRINKGKHAAGKEKK